MPFPGSMASAPSRVRTAARVAPSDGSLRTIATEPPAVHGMAFHSVMRPLPSSLNNPASRNAVLLLPVILQKEGRRARHAERSSDHTARHT